MEHLKQRALSEKEAFSRLVEIVSLLRKECPWDRKQTHATLTSCLLEETYEVIDAIENVDMDNLKEELGDVALQVIFHSILAKEEGSFSLMDVLNEESEKMIRRHPHVFQKEDAKTVDKVLEKWENIKEEEQGKLSQRQKLEKIPKSMPALIRSRKVQKKAAAIGFDWDNFQDAFLKITEETEELLEAREEFSKQRVEEELGDLLFAVVNVSRFLKVDPELALQKATEKFIHRFAKVEERAVAQGKSLDTMSLEEMDQLWNQVKEQEYL